MNADEKIKIVGTIFESWDGTATPETPLESLGWDSMAMMGFIALLKSRFNKQMNVADLGRMKTVADLLQLLP